MGGGGHRPLEATERSDAGRAVSKTGRVVRCRTLVTTNIRSTFERSGEQVDRRPVDAGLSPMPDGRWSDAGRVWALIVDGQRRAVGPWKRQSASLQGSWFPALGFW